MITEKGKVFSMEAEIVQVTAVVDGVDTQVRMRAIGVQIITDSGHTLKLVTRGKTDLLVGDVVSINVTEGE